ncbi:hypothetical protein MTO96_026287 [Rhipicephalus appendiculatus]
MRIRHWFHAVARQLDECPVPCGWVRCSLITASLVVLGMLFAIAVVAGNNYARFSIANDDSDGAAALVYNRPVDPPLSYTKASKDECTSMENYNQPPVAIPPTQHTAACPRFRSLHEQILEDQEARHAVRRQELSSSSNVASRQV